MSLDTVELEIMSRSADEQQAKAARRIIPVREQGNLLLVTLLLINTIVTELLPLVLDTLYPGGVFALAASVTSIVLFGEIIPQAVCSRHALVIGSYMINFVKVARFVMYPIAAPIAYLLDKLLGEELGNVYSRDQLKGLIDVHSRNKFGVLTDDETLILKGTLDFSQKTVADIMTEADDVLMLDIDTVLNRKTLKWIMKVGHSRIPLYTKIRSNVVALLLVKQLLLVDPSQNIAVRELISRKKRAHKIRVSPPIYCSCTTLLPDLLNEFQMGRSHMAIVFDDIQKPEEERRFLGVVTLEDIIEEVIMEEIQDETDVYQDNREKKPILVRDRNGRLMRTTSAALNRPAVANPNLTLRLRDIDVEALRKPLLDDRERNPDYGPDESMSSLFGGDEMASPRASSSNLFAPPMIRAKNITRGASGATSSPKTGRRNSISRIDLENMYQKIAEPKTQQPTNGEGGRTGTVGKPPLIPAHGKLSKAPKGSPSKASQEQKSSGSGEQKKQEDVSAENE